MRTLLIVSTVIHRTFDPEEADYFFVPTMAGCLYDVYGWNPIPMWPPKLHGEGTWPYAWEYLCGYLGIRVVCIPSLW